MLRCGEVSPAGKLRLALPMAALAAVVCAPGGPGGRLLASAADLFVSRWPEDCKVAIEWKSSWDETYRHNQQRWYRELMTGDRRPRDGQSRLAVRLIVLLEALIAKYPQEVDRQVEARAAISRHLAQLGHDHRAVKELREAIAAAPGRVDVAVRMLGEILKLAKGRTGRPETHEWIEYAARRLLALNRVGRLGDADSAVIDALTMQFGSRYDRGSFMAAADTLGVLEGRLGRTDAVRLQAGELFSAAGYLGKALQIYQDLSATTLDRRVLEQIRRLSSRQVIWQPKYLMPRELVNKVKALPDSQPVSGLAAGMAELFAADAGGRFLTHWEDVRFTSVWSAMARRLAALPDEARASLADVADREARALLAPAAAASGTGELLRLFRRYPWTTAGQEALLAYGEREARAGHAGLALRSFREVLAWATRDDLRHWAEVGLRLGGTPEAVTTAPASSAADRRLPHRVLAVPAVECWPPRLLEGVPSDILPGLALVRHNLQAAGEKVLLSAPRVLACYASGGTRLLWKQASPLPDGIGAPREVDPAPHYTIPGAFEPAVADGRVFSRWGLDPTGRYPVAVAAFDAADGRMLWSTRRDPLWQDLWPAGDPAAADGRVYVLALARGTDPTRTDWPVLLVCLDAGDGRVRWRRLLAELPLAMLPVPSDERGQRKRGREADGEEGFDVARYGSAVTVHEGAVYCSTNMGLVARCDARDGAIEWVSPYFRLRVARGADRVLNRRGPAPIVVGDKVIFLPRDYAGALALLGRTGEVAWERPLVASQAALGVVADLPPPPGATGPPSGTLVLADEDNLVGLDAETGATRWARRLPEPMCAPPHLAGAVVRAGTRRQLQRIDARTGRVLAAQPWGDDGPMSSFVVSGSTVVGVTDRSVRPDAGRFGLPLNPAAPQRAGRLGSGLRRVWHLGRAQPRLFVPPPSAGIAGKVFVCSGGVLECAEASPRGAVLWQRMLPVGLADLFWARGGLFVRYARHVIAVDPATGRQRWRLEVPFEIGQTLAASKYLAIASSEWSHLAAADLDSGELLWMRGLDGLVWPDRRWPDCRLGWDGQNLRVIGCVNQRDRSYSLAVIRPTDGTVTAVMPLLADRSTPRAVSIDGGIGFALMEGYRGRGRALRALALGERACDVAPQASLGALMAQTESELRPNENYHAYRWELRTFRQEGEWLEVGLENWRAVRKAYWYFRHGAPEVWARLPRPGVVRDNLLYDPDGRTLRVIDPASRCEPLQYVLPVIEWRQHRPRILHFWPEGDEMLVISGLEKGFAFEVEPEHLRFDVFDRKTGAHRRGSQIAEAAYWIDDRPRKGYWGLWQPTEVKTQVAVVGGVLLLTDADGLHAFAGSAGPEPRDEGLRVAFRRDGPIQVDGSVEEWEGSSAAACGRGKLYVGHDATRLNLAVSYPDDELRLRHGGGGFGGGDWLQVALKTNAAEHHWAIGVEGTGRVLWENLGRRRLPLGRLASIRHDLTSGEHVYELSVPLDGVADVDRQGWREVSLGVKVWEYRPPAGAVAVLAWGASSGGAEAPGGGYFLHSVSREQEAAATELADRLGDLAASRAFMGVLRDLRGRTAQSAAAFARQYFRRHPDGVTTEQLMLWLDGRFRAGAADDPAPAVLKIAAEAGVDEAVRRRYRRVAGAHLSQWVHTDAQRRPRMLMMKLHDGSGWAARVSWGQFHWTWLGEPGTPSRRLAGDLPPGGAWGQLRVPLLWLGLHDRAIHGLFFGQHGGAGAVWDRTALVVDGTEAVVLEDSLPAGRTEGLWDWSARPVRSGKRAHTYVSPIDPDDAVGHYVVDLRQPLTQHMAPPSQGGAISQWVYLDAAAPPASLAITLDDGEGTRFRAVWGAPDEAPKPDASGLEHRGEGRILGPLPECGKWAELTIPLAWTDLLDRPIRELRFEQRGGTVAWDRTAVRNGRREVVLIEDSPPAGTLDGNWAWTAERVRSGGKARLQTAGEGRAHHAVAAPASPIVGHLSFDPSAASDLLRRQIPRLGTTDVAWGFFRGLLRLAPADVTARTALYEEFLRAAPRHPRCPEVLADLLAYYRRANWPDPVETVDGVIARCKVAHAGRYAYRRRHTHADHAFLRRWQIAGPFPNPDGAGHDVPHGPELGPIRLEDRYEALFDQMVGFQLRQSKYDYVDLGAALGAEADAAVGYAVCWVNSPRARLAALAVSANDACKVWVNRRLVHRHSNATAAAPGRHVARVFFRSGWNEVLLKVSHTSGNWGFFAELVDAEGRGPLQDVELAWQPPE